MERTPNNEKREGVCLDVGIRCLYGMTDEPRQEMCLHSLDAQACVARRLSFRHDERVFSREAWLTRHHDPSIQI